MTARDPQDVFDAVARHLLTQGRQSSDGRGTCLYRGPEGTMCAVGCLIPDEIYTPNMEGISVDELREIHQHPEIFSDNTELLRSLQEIHDLNEPVVWRSLLRAVAIDHDLSSEILDAPRP